MPGYAITVGRELGQQTVALIEAAASAHRFAIITDDIVRPLYAEPLAERFADRAVVFSMPDGERHKTRESWARLTDDMLDAGFGRDTAVIACGGGVVGDLGGFVAATFMRGVRVIQMPTTLLAMIDASVGGKTGVDAPAGKNLIGAFHAPAAVIADLSVLRTLPRRHFIAGLAEAVKHGVVRDAMYFEWIASVLPELTATDGATSAPVAALVTRSIEIKAAVVRADEREGGLRQILNFGHTVGHAIEAGSGYALLHGEAIAIGMVIEAQIAERLGVAASGTAARIREVLRRAQLPVTLPGDADIDGIMRLTSADKKSRRGAAHYALPARIGEMAAGENWTIPVDDGVVREMLAANAQ